MLLRISTLLIIIILVISSCVDTTDKVDLPNTDQIELDNKIVSILADKDGKFNQKTLNLAGNEFKRLYFERIIGIDSLKLNMDSINAVFSDTWIKSINDTIKMVFPNVERLEKEYNNALKLLKYYQPGYKTPNVYFCNTLLNYQRFIFSDVDRDGLGLGLDMFLNKYIDYKKYDIQNPAFSDYLTKHFDENHVVSKGMYLICEEVVGQSNGIRMLDRMIHQGKIIFLLEQVLPLEEKHILFDFTKDQYEWCTDREVEIWSFFNQEKLIYETSPSKISKYVGDSPNSPGMPESAPGKTATYIGWQIVKQWMKKTGSDIDQLLAENDAQKILDQSRFKPRR
jgi:hypothetical protein